MPQTFSLNHCYVFNETSVSVFLLEVEFAEDGMSSKSEGSEPKFKAELQNETPTMGETITLHVQVAGNPLPEVTWLFNEHLLTESGKVSYTSCKSRHTLTVINITASDLGIYECRASNLHGTATSKCLIAFSSGINADDLLQVAQAPKIEDPPEDVVAVKQGATLMLMCQISGSPSPTGIKLRICT